MRYTAEIGFVLGTVLAVTAVSGGQRELLSSCREAVDSGDHQIAIEHCLRAAELGVAEAQFYAAFLIYEGDGVEEDNAEAIRWYTEAAKRGHIEAQYNLALIYDEGDWDVWEDNMEAVRWYTEAAKRGHIEAQYSLGLMYDLGEGVPEDDTIAVKWYGKAAKQGHADAQNDLGLMYDAGEGVRENDAMAIKWYTKAAEQGLVDAKRNLRILEIGKADDPVDGEKIVSWFELQAEAPRHVCIVVESTPEELEAAAEQEVLEAKIARAKAEAGDLMSRLELGIKLLRGEGVEKNQTQAAKWLSLAAEQGQPNAQFLLGTLYATGRGVPEDDVKALMWLNLAAAPFADNLAEEGKALLRGRMTRDQIAQAQRLSTRWFKGFESTEFAELLASFSLLTHAH